jgi:hypothetical protein
MWRKTPRQHGGSADEQPALDGGRMVVPIGWRRLALVLDYWLVHRSGGQQLGSGQSRQRDE